MPRRFSVHATRDGRLFVFDDEFGYDAKLQLDGDFATEHHRREHADAVAAALNAAALPTPETSAYDERGEPRTPPSPAFRPDRPS